MTPPVQISTQGRIAACGFSRKVRAEQRLPSIYRDCALIPRDARKVVECDPDKRSGPLYRAQIRGSDRGEDDGNCAEIIRSARFHPAAPVQQGKGLRLKSKD